MDIRTAGTSEDEQMSIDAWRRARPYVQWVDSLGLPIYRGYYIPNLKTLPLGRWDARDCDVAFLQLAGQGGVSEARVTEIAPGQTLPPVRFALDEIVYVVDGRGLSTVWTGDHPKVTFEWQKRSMFLLPRNHWYQLSNVQGTQPVRLLHCNYLPTAMTTIPDADYFFSDPYEDSARLYKADGSFYAQAQSISRAGTRYGTWSGNFFPDLLAWDRLNTSGNRGAGGHRVSFHLPESPITCHMSIFPSKTYKKAHRHGPGFVIVIPGGEGYSVMWLEGREKVFVPWHEGSVFVPPDRWFHQHFNVGPTPARYLALHPPELLSGLFEGRVPREDQIEYTVEDSIIRERFAGELGKRGLTSLMPEQCYVDPTYQWNYEEEE